MNAPLPAAATLGARAGSPSPDEAWRALHQAASLPYRSAGRFAWHFARGKLGRDPVFRALLERGDVPAGAHVLDIGCGQALFASLLSAVDAQLANSGWPAAWPAAPARTHYTGIELMPRDIARAQAALGGSGDRARLVCADMRQAELPASDVVLLMDVLHYIDIAAQDALLARVRNTLRPRGRLLMRVGDAARKRSFAFSQWVDHSVTRLRGHAAAPTWGRPLDAWAGRLQQLGFVVQRLPMNRGTPFPNMLLVGDLA
jgi:SAM-dependent methyltransferase